MHWAYKVFIRKIEAPDRYAACETGTLCVDDTESADNADNLAADYISDILDTMSDKQKARFRDGLWVKAEGVVYEKFSEDALHRKSCPNGSTL